MIKLKRDITHAPGPKIKSVRGGAIVYKPQKTINPIKHIISLYKVVTL